MLTLPFDCWTVNFRTTPGAPHLDTQSEFLISHMFIAWSTGLVHIDGHTPASIQFESWTEFQNVTVIGSAALCFSLMVQTSLWQPRHLLCPWTSVGLLRMRIHTLMENTWPLEPVFIGYILVNVYTHLSGVRVLLVKMSAWWYEIVGGFVYNKEESVSLPFWSSICIWLGNDKITMCLPEQLAAINGAV